MGSQIIDNFCGPAQELAFAGILFDMDGTIIDSTEAVVRHWHSIGNELGVDPSGILRTSHGRRSIDVLRDIDPSKANWEYISYMESLIPLRYGSSAREIPGARPLIASLAPLSVPWAIVTSGTRPLVTGWLSILSLPVPDHLVVAEDVENGKPDPSCYVLGLQKLGLHDRAGEVLVVEDSPAGIKAGKAAGCRVLGVVTSHMVEQVVGAGPDWIVKDLESVRAVRECKGGEGVVLEIKGVLEMP